MFRRLLPVGIGFCACVCLLSGCSPASKTEPTSRELAAAELPDDEALRERIDTVLDYTQHHRELNSLDNAAWQIMHGILAFGRDFEITDQNERVAALDWVLGGGRMDGWNVRPASHGVHAQLEPGTSRGQGHPDQWLAVISQCDLPSTTPLHVRGKRYTIRDLVTQAMHEVYRGKECSWTLIGLSSYLPLDAEWEAQDGSTWTIEEIMQTEADQDLHASACGGSHRLIGMTMALDRFRQENPNQELAGGWKAAQEDIDWAIERAREYQQPSGALSVNYFSRPGNSPDLSKHLGATGHTLEFLSLALDKQQLSEPWVVRAVVFLCDLFEKTKGRDLECGALYHAAHGLVLYREKRFGPRESGPESGRESVAKQVAKSKARPIAVD